MGTATAPARASDSGITTEEAARISGATLRQIGWWCKCRIFSPRIIQHVRLFSRAEVMHVCLVTELRRKGMFGVQGSRQGGQIRSLLRRIDRSLRARGLKAARELYLVTDGAKVKLEKSKRAVIDRMKDLCIGAYVVDLAEIRRRVEKEQ